MLISDWSSDVCSSDLIEFWDGAFLANLVTIISNYSLFGIAAFFVNSSVKNARAKQTEAGARLVEAERRLQAAREKNRCGFFLLAGQVAPHFIANLLNGDRKRVGVGKGGSVRVD